MKYLIALALVISSALYAEREITGLWLSESGDHYAEFTKDGMLVFTSLDVKENGRSANRNSPARLLGREPIPYELLHDRSGIILKTARGNFLADIRELSFSKLVVTANSMAFIYRRIDEAELAKVREEAKEKAKLTYVKLIPKNITNNLRQIAAAGQQYILEEGVTSATFKQLEGEYFAKIKSVNGEKYDDIVVLEKGGELSVTDKDGKTVTYKY